MTTVGHSLLGLSIAALTVPPSFSRKRFIRLASIFVLAANLPDIPLPGWGHSAYLISHSFPVTAALAAGAFVLVSKYRPELIAFRALPWLLALAWMSHMVLDSTYSHGNGLAVYWPLSDAHLAMPLPWFDTLALPVRSERNLEVLGTELTIYGALAALAVGLRYCRHGHTSR